MSILIKNIEEIHTMTKQANIIKDAYIIIADNIIKEIGEMSEFEDSDTSFEQVIEAKGKLAIPGLINTHTHAAMTLLRGYADDLPLHNWLTEKIWPFEKTLTSEDIYWGSILAIMEMITTGTTCFADMYFQMDMVAKAVEETGIRAVLSQGLIETNDGMTGLKEAHNFCKKWAKQKDTRITTMLAPHAPYTCSADYLKEIINLATKDDLAIHIHVAETLQEKKEIEAKYSLTPIQYLNSLGLFTRPTLAAHCVYLTEIDLKIMADKELAVAYNPASNMKLASGIAKVKEMLEYGITVSIGTDGVASNNSLDLILEARLASYLQKVNYLDPTVLPINQLLKMLTVNGAKALRLKNLGQLKEGFIADLILVDIYESPSFYPHHNNLSNLFYAKTSNNIDTVIINGQIIMEDKNLLTIDKEKVFFKIEEIIKSKK